MDTIQPVSNYIVAPKGTALIVTASPGHCNYWVAKSLTIRRFRLTHTQLTFISHSKKEWDDSGQITVHRVMCESIYTTTCRSATIRAKLFASGCLSLPE